MRLKIVLQAYIFNNNNNNQNPFNMDILILCFICLNKGLIFNHSKKVVLFVRVYTTPLFTIIKTTENKALKTKMLTFGLLKKILFCYKQLKLI